MLLKVVMRRKKAMGSVIIAQRKTILLATTWNFQKTSVDLGNLYANDWW